MTLMKLTDATRGAWQLGTAGLVMLMSFGLIGCGGKGGSTPSQTNGAMPASGTAASSAQANTSAAKIVDLGRAHTNKFLGYTETEALKNMLGGARAVFIAPDVGGGAFLVGVDRGAGFLMRRHGDDWSDPVFYNLTETSAGEQLGIKDAHVIVLLMTETAVYNFINGKVVMGGSGGMTLGTVGMSVTGAGGTKGGLEMMVISTSQGFALGGGFATIEPSLNTDLNAQAYGSSIDPKAILNSAGGKYAPAVPFRKDLTQMVLHAWEVQHANPSVAMTNDGR